MNGGTWTTCQPIRTITCILMVLVLSPLRPASGIQAAAAPALQVTVTIELDEPAAIQRITAHNGLSGTTNTAQRQAVQAYIAHLDNVQQKFVPLFAQMNARVLYRMQRLTNSITIRISADQIADLRALPGVRAVQPLVRKYHTAMPHIPPYIGASTVWESAAAPATGRGITIAVIDSGIDYTHATFGGAGTPAAYVSNDSTIIEDTSFPTTKVVGGYDFVGDAYVAGSDDPAKAAISDPDPLDCAADGHGTAVAALAAGMGVTNDGMPYTGPYSAATPFASLQLDPGIAPAANLYALRVFGCDSQGTDYVDAALERAVDPNGDGDLSDHVDVITMALGAAFADLDSTSTAANAAARLGVVVVASTGNNGDTTATVGAPASADAVIAVAASRAPDETLASYSARGPRQPDAVLKPDLAAPGYALTSANVGTGNATVIFNGTSAATPVAAGSMALLKQLHPTWSSADLKALAMNTATHDLRLDTTPTAPLVSPMRVGAGRVDVAQAATSAVIAYSQNHPERVSISFGALAANDVTTHTQTITVVNKGAEAFSGDVTYQPMTSIPGVTATLDQTQVELAPGGTATLHVTLTIVPDQLQHARDPALAATQDGQPRHWLSEASGYVTITPTVTALPSVRVPVYAAVHRAASMQTYLQPTSAAALTRTLELTGTGFGPGLGATTLPTQTQSLASVYELQASSPPLTATLRPQADLAAVGIAQTAERLIFGLGVYAPWFTPTPYLQQFRVLIDTNGSGVAANGTGAEYVLATTDRGTRQDQEPTDVFETVLTHQPTGIQTVEGPLNGLSPAVADTAIFSSTVLALPLRIADLRLPTGQTRISYRVQSYASVPGRYEPQRIDDSGELHYDLAAPHSGVNATYQDLPYINDLPGTLIAIHSSQSDQPVPLVVFHHQNRPGHQIEIVPLAIQSLYLPLTSR